MIGSRQYDRYSFSEENKIFIFHAQSPCRLLGFGQLDKVNLMHRSIYTRIEALLITLRKFYQYCIINICIHSSSFFLSSCRCIYAHNFFFFFVHFFSILFNYWNIRDLNDTSKQIERRGKLIHEDYVSSFGLIRANIKVVNYKDMFF